MKGKRCPDCGQPMTRYVTGWKCMNVKAHAKSLRNPNKGAARNPRGVNQTAQKKPSKGRYVLTDCPNCENGQRLNPKRCTLCKKRGRVWTIK